MYVLSKPPAVKFQGTVLYGCEVITNRETCKKPRYNILQLFLTSEYTRELQSQVIQSESTPGSYLRGVVRYFLNILVKCAIFL